MPRGMRKACLALCLSDLNGRSTHSSLMTRCLCLFLLLLWIYSFRSSLSSSRRKQVPIALRGVKLLKVGCEMVYSTCSLNPIENEAVVAEVLRRCGGMRGGCSSCVGHAPTQSYVFHRRGGSGGCVRSHSRTALQTRIDCVEGVSVVILHSCRRISLRACICFRLDVEMESCTVAMKRCAKSFEFLYA